MTTEEQEAWVRRHRENWKRKHSTPARRFWDRQIEVAIMTALCCLFALSVWAVVILIVSHRP